MNDAIKLPVHAAREHPMYNINAGLHIYDADGRSICIVPVADDIGITHARNVRHQIVVALNAQMENK